MSFCGSLNSSLSSCSVSGQQQRISRIWRFAFTSGFLRFLLFKSGTKTAPFLHRFLHLSETRLLLINDLRQELHLVAQTSSSADLRRALVPLAHPCYVASRHLGPKTKTRIVRMGNKPGDCVLRSPIALCPSDFEPRSIRSNSK